METLDNPKTPAKPLVIIKKGTIYKTSNVPILLKTLIKRPNPNVSVEDNPSAKRLCPDFERPIKEDPNVGENMASTDDKTKNQVQDDKKPKKYVKKSNSILARQTGGVCIRHDEPLLEHQAEGLLQPGDTFASIDEFNKYITEFAKKWYFYYVRSETRLNKPHGTCVYRCKFFRKHQRCQSTGKRAQKNKSISLSCPASVHLKRTANSEEIKVTLVCHHHTHELSKEVFEKQPHGYRLPREIKDEIRDLALLNVHPALIRKYVESKVPDLNIGKTVINTVLKLRNQGVTKDILGPERMTEMLAKIRYIKSKFDICVTTGSRGKHASKSLKAKTNVSKKANISETMPKRKVQKGLVSNKELTQSGSESPIDESTIKWEMERQNEGDGDLDTTVENDTEYEELYTYDYASDDVMDVSYEECDGDDDKKPILLINPTTGTFEPEVTETAESDENLLLINPKTGMLDEIVPKLEQNDESEQTYLKKYKIGNISIECTESVDDSGNATFTLNQIKSKGGLTESNVLNQLSKVEQSLYEPVDYSMLTEKKGGKKKNSAKKDPVVEAKLRCKIKHGELPEQQAEGLVQVGSTFSSIDELLAYAASHASKWFFYYHVFDSRNTKASPKYNSNKSILYNLSCRFNKGFYKSKSKGLRKVKQNNIQCPAGLNVKCAPGEDKLTVTYACHHHSHELSAELFSKEAHGHRLPQELKDEIRVLAWYKLDSRLIKQYLEDITGLNMGKTIKNIVAMMKKKGVKVDVPPEKMTEVLEKIKAIKQKFQIPKRASSTRKSKREAKVYDTSDSEKEEVQNKSRVETRLNNILYDQELIQSVKELQENTGCEIELNPWGGVDVINDGVNLQEGVVIETEYNESQDNESQDNDEHTECQIKIDQEVYNMDDTVQYIIPSDQVESNNILGVEFADRVVYVEENDETVSEVNNTVVYVEENNETISEVNNSVVYVEENDETVSEDNNRVVYVEENNETVSEVNNTLEYGSTVIYEEGTILSMESNENVYNKNGNEVVLLNSDENTSNTEQYHHVTHDYSDNENEYHQYANNQEPIKDVESHNNRIYEVRDVGVQADSPIIDLEKEYEKIIKLESAVVHEDIGKSKFSHSSRSLPKFIIEEIIINRFNIEFYINHCGFTICLDNLAATMCTPVLTLLKQLYQGEAVFKMIVGTSGRQNRKTVQVVHIPLTIAFPFEKFKYMNCLQEYKTICSKYSDVAMQLENTVQTISKALEAKTLELEEVRSQNLDHSQIIGKYEELLRKNTLLEETLKKNQTDLAEAKQQNHTLTKKITHLEKLNLTSRINDAEILKQLLQPTTEQEEDSKAMKENKILKRKIRELTEELHERSEDINSKLIERIKSLEASLNQVNAENINYKLKIRKLEQLYLTDSQSLLDKIKTLEAQIEAYKEASDDNFAENQNALKLLTITESKCRKLEKQVKHLEALRSSDKKREISKMKRIEETHLKKKVYGTRSRQRND